jgi:hypothetical protein
MKITFGKHQGKEIEELPISYVVWGMNHITSVKWKTVMSAEFKRRHGHSLSDTYQLTNIQ